MHFPLKLSAVSSLAAVLLATSAARSQAPATVTVRIDANKPHQTIANFAASDAWAGQFVGNWPNLFQYLKQSTILGF